MKKITFLLILVASSVFGQKFTNRFQFAINGTQIDGDGFSGYRKIGFNIGLGTQWNLKTAGSSIGFEMNYIQKGSKQNRNEKLAIYNDVDIKLNYLEFPIYYSFAKWGLFFDAGPTISYLISAEESYNDIPYTPEYDYRKIELGASLNIKAEITEKIQLKINVANSLSSIRKVTANNTGYWYQVGAFHRIIGVGIVYSFNPQQKTVD